jgi:hypothetical protein
VETSDTKIQRAVASDGSNAFEIDVEFADVKKFVVRLAGGELEFRPEINITPNCGLDVHRGVVDAKLRIGKRALGAGVEECNGGFAGDADLSRGAARCGGGRGRG